MSFGLQLPTILTVDSGMDAEDIIQIIKEIRQELEGPARPEDEAEIKALL